MSLPIQICVRIAMMSLVLGAAVRVSTPAHESASGKNNPSNLITSTSFVWHDSNRNGIFDEQESPLKGVAVQLFAAGQTEPLAFASSDAQGRIEMRVLHQPGHFHMKFLAPGGYIFTTAARPEKGVVNNDANAEGLTPLFFNRSFRGDIDAGLVRVYASRETEAEAVLAP